MVIKKYREYISSLALAISAVVALVTLNLVAMHYINDFCVLAILVFAITTTPIYLLSFSEGSAFAFGAILVAFVLASFLVSLAGAIFELTILWMPAAFFAFLLKSYWKKGRKKIYLSLSQIFFSTILTNIIGILLFTLFLSNNAALISLIKDSFLREMLLVEKIALSLNSEYVTKNLVQSYDLLQNYILNNIISITAVNIAFYAIFFLISNLALSKYLEKKLNLPNYRKISFIKELRLPIISLGVLAAAIISPYIYQSPIINLVCGCLVSAFSAALLICGFAYLHKITLSIKARNIFLSLIYCGFLFTYSLLPLFIIILILGIISIINQFKNSREFI